MAMKDKTISKAECEYLCGLMSAPSTNVKETSLDTQNLGFRLSNSIVELGEFPDGADLKEMMIEWIDVEDNEEVIGDDVMETLEELESMKAWRKRWMATKRTLWVVTITMKSKKMMSHSSHLSRQHHTCTSFGDMTDLLDLQKMSTLFSLMGMNGALPVRIRQK
jgi:hypothetical protein